MALVALALVLVATACQPPRIGSNGPSFGNNLVGDLNGNGTVQAGECFNPFAPCAGTQPQFWAAITSPYYDNQHGDPFSSRCLTGTSCTPDPSNPEFRPAGYTYGIEVVEPGQTVTVEIYDAPAFPQSIAANYTGDYGAFRTQYELFGEDGSAVTTSTDPALSLAGQCASGPGRRNYPANYQPASHHNQWATLCTFTAPAAGVYPLVVKTSDLADDVDTGAAGCSVCIEATRGFNAYAIRASAGSGGAPKVFAIGDMSTYFPLSGGVATVPLVEVPESRAGDRLIVDLYDPGDGSGTGYYTLALRDPSATWPPSCTLAYGAPDGVRTDPPVATESHFSCEFTTRANGVNRFNSAWVRLVVDIPPGYSCGTDCWWDLEFDAGTSGGAVERLTTVVSFEEPT